MPRQSMKFERIIIVRTLLTEWEIDALMELSKETNRKDAVREAVLHFLQCKKAKKG